MPITETRDSTTTITWTQADRSRQPAADITEVTTGDGKTLRVWTRDTNNPAMWESPIPGGKARAGWRVLIGVYGPVRAEVPAGAR